MMSSPVFEPSPRGLKADAITLLPNLFLRALALLVGNKMKVVSHLNVIGLTWLLRQKDRQQGYHCDKHRTQKITPCSNPPPARQYQ